MSFLNAEARVLFKKYLLRGFIIIGGGESFEDLYYFKGGGDFFR